MPEVWRPVVGLEGCYEVSSHGRLRTVARVVVRRNGSPLTIHGRMRTIAPNAHGYPSVRLSQAGEDHPYELHALVAAAFLGPRPGGMEVRHLDGKQANCRADNLRYGTPGENRRDSVEHGTHLNARKTHCAQGHEFSEANTRVTKRGRACRTCAQAWQSTYEQRKRSACRK